MSQTVTIVGAGLAGSEAAWQVAQRGVPVRLCEMRPQRTTSAHHTPLAAELTGANSLRSHDPATAHGMLKDELRRLGSLLLTAAEAAAIPAGQMLAVDRALFATSVTAGLTSHPLIELVRKEITELPDSSPVILAPGPLLSQPLARSLFRLSGSEYRFFCEGVPPMVDARTINHAKLLAGARFDQGDVAQLNSPMNEGEYDAFYEALLGAESTLPAGYDPAELLEGSLPLEVIAGRGPGALTHGPMKPAGLVDPRTGAMPHAAVQFRPEDAALTAYYLVGFSTSLTSGEQERVFRMIPGLEQARFLRYGSVHRYAYVNAPGLLRPTGQLRSREGLLLAGRITGLGGYMESVGSGWLAGLNAVRFLQGEPALALPREIMLGALLHHLTSAEAEDAPPLIANFGLLPPLEVTGEKLPKAERKAGHSRRGQAALTAFLTHNAIVPVACDARRAD